MHAEGKKATQTSKAADNEREGVLNLNPLSKAITCTQFETRHLFKIEASSFFCQAQACSSRSPTWSTHSGLHTSGSTQRTWPRGWTSSSRCPTCQVGSI